MASSKQTIKTEIKDHINKCGWGSYGWYIGIAEDPKQRLFTDHNVDQQNDAWIYREAESSYIARDIEVELIDELKAKGDSGGGSYLTKYVYGYKITSKSKE